MQAFNVTFTVDVYDRDDVQSFIENVLDGTKIDILGWKIESTER